VIGPAVNLWGSGSFLLSLFPDLARSKRLDTFYPVSSLPRYPYAFGPLDYAPGFQRYVDPQQRFEFRYPATYVQDQAVFLRNADRAYAQRTADPQGVMGSSGERRRTGGGGGPDAAFGPPGQTGEENLSVVIGAVPAGFSLQSLGPPADAAERLVQKQIAKPGLREVRLLGASERPSARRGSPLYQFEYVVEYVGLEGKRPTYTVCVVGVRGGELITFASRVPEAVWAAKADALREAASSFELI